MRVAGHWRCSLRCACSISLVCSSCNVDSRDEQSARCCSCSRLSVKTCDRSAWDGLPCAALLAESTISRAVYRSLESSRSPRLRLDNEWETWRPEALWSTLAGTGPGTATRTTLIPGTHHLYRRPDSASEFTSNSPSGHRQWPPTLRPAHPDRFGTRPDRPTCCGTKLTTVGSPSIRRCSSGSFSPRVESRQSGPLGGGQKPNLYPEPQLSLDR